MAPPLAISFDHLPLVVKLIPHLEQFITNCRRPECDTAIVNIKATK